MSPPVKLGPFLLGAPLGSGGTGTVFHATHDPSGIAAAVKVVRLTADHRPVRNNLDAEVAAVVALDHPNIVQVYDIGEVDPVAAARSSGQLVAGTPWYAMELADEGSLRRRLRTLDWGELGPILHELLDALAHAHARGVLHLDLKPDNVLFGGRRAGAKLSDFGMGVVGAANPDDDFVRGTPHYMAPEQVRGRWEELGPWTDLYALGCLVWRCVTGETSIVLDTPREVLEAQIQRGPGAFDPRFDVPAGLEGWVRELLHKDPARRYRWAADATRALRVLEGGADRGPGPPADWRVDERHAAAEVLPVTGLGLAAVREPPFVGRTREREQLWTAFRRASAGAVRVVVIRGPVGVGKSRLAQWLGSRAHELGGATVLAGAHRPGARGLDVGIVGAIRRQFPVDLRSADAEVELGARLQAQGLSAPAARDAATLLAHGWGGDPVGDRTWWEVLTDVLQIAAADRTPIVFLDDVQWGGTSLECVAWILGSGRSPPALWVLTANDEALLTRPAEEELLAGIQALPFAETLAMGPLSEQASAALARRLLPLEPSLSAEVADRGGGSPLFQVQLMHDWARRRILEPGPEGLRLREGVAVSPPPALDSLWSATLDRALAGRADWRAALDVAAILGPEVDVGEWQSGCAELGMEAPRTLILELLKARLVAFVGPERTQRWVFVHPVLRDVLVNRVIEAGRGAEVHLACARVVDPTDPERRAMHLVRAGRPEEALPDLLTLMDAATVGEVGRAGHLLKTVEDVAEAVVPAGDPRWASIEGHRVRLLLAMGRPEEARAAALRQRAAAGDDLEAAFGAERNLVGITIELGNGQAALEHAANAERLAEQIGESAILASAWVLSSAARRSVGQIAEARADVEWASLLVLPSQVRETMELWLEMALVAVAGGRYRAARRALERLSRAAESSGARRATAVAALRSGDAWLAVGEAAHALHQYQTARRRFRALGHADEGLAQLGLAAALLALGRDEEADDVLERVRGRPLPPRQRLRLTLDEVVLRAGRPMDPAFTAHWREARELLEAYGAIEPGIVRLLELAATRASRRPERARELEAELRRYRPPGG